MNTKRITAIFAVLMLTVLCVSAYVSVPTITDGIGFQYRNTTISDTVAADHIYSLAMIDPPVIQSMKYITNTSTPGYRGAHDVDIQGQYAYVTCYFNDAVHVFDLTDPESPVLVDTLTNASGYLNGTHDIVVDGNYAYVVNCLDDSMVSIDISDPAAIEIVSRVYHNIQLSYVHALHKSGDLIACGSYDSNSFTLVDVSDPTSISIAGSIAHSDLSHVRGTAIVGDVAYAACKNSGKLVSLDISNPASPTILDTVQFDHLSMVKVRGDYAYTSSYSLDMLHAVDISDPSNMRLVGNVTVEEASYIEIWGRYAIVAQFGVNGNPGYRFIDIGDPANMYEAAYIIADDLAYGTGMKVYNDSYLICCPREDYDSAIAIVKLSEHAIYPNYDIYDDYVPKSEIVYSIRNTTTASGDVFYSCGFEPTKVEAFAAIKDTSYFSHGFADDDADEYCMYTAQYRTNWVSPYFIFVRYGGTTGQSAKVKSYNATGVTLEWTKMGSGSDDIKVAIIASR